MPLAAPVTRAVRPLTDRLLSVMCPSLFFFRHCERSNEASQRLQRKTGLLRCARNDGYLITQRDRGLRSGRRISPSRVCARRSEEQTSEIQSLMRISYAVFCLQKTKQKLL